MKKEEKELKEWLVNYIKNRDILLRQVESISEKSKEWDVVVKAKKGEETHYIVRGDIDNFGEIAKKLDDTAITLVVLNKRKNLDVLIENWGKIKHNPKFCVIFANPNSDLEKKWVVFPHTHEKVTEKASLIRGLKSLFQTVDPVD